MCSCKGSMWSMTPVMRARLVHRLGGPASRSGRLIARCCRLLSWTACLNALGPPPSTNPTIHLARARQGRHVTGHRRTTAERRQTVQNRPCPGQLVKEGSAKKESSPKWQLRPGRCAGAPVRCCPTASIRAIPGLRALRQTCCHPTTAGTQLLRRALPAGTRVRRW